MDTVLIIATFVLNCAGALFAVVYVALNLFMNLDEYGEFRDKNRNASFVMIASAVLSLAFAFCICLFVPVTSAESTIAISAALYGIIAMTWLIVIVLCGCAMLFLIISKLGYSAEKVKGVRTVFFIALGTVIISCALFWLLA